MVTIPPCHGARYGFESRWGRQICEYRIGVITPDFQSGDDGSIPSIRSKGVWEPKNM